MELKGNPESNIPETKNSTNKKRAAEFRDGDKKFSVALLKKNEFALILFGALALTIIVFFFFFRSS
ncbi:MAG: LysM domain-containing protein, partial [Desulfobacteraceae bacterium]|nr:LysM domain-containing protein [Desulfobacteraceae bacterium]